jgi:hypothetical protein
MDSLIQIENATKLCPFLVSWLPSLQTFLEIIHDSSPTAFAESLDLSRSSSAVHLQEVMHRNRLNQVSRQLLQTLCI